MAYDNNEPADDSKVRDFPSLTRANFQAIQSGASSFGVDQTNYDVQAGAPATGALANKIITYCNDDAAGVASFFAYNESGNSIQITEGDYLGAVGQKFALQSLSFDTSDSKYTLDGNFICHAYGYFNSSGTLSAARSKNIASVGAPSSSVYTIVTEAIYANANIVVVATCEETTDRFAVINATPTIAAGALTIKLKTRNTGGTAIDAGCNFLIFGGM